MKAIASCALALTLGCTPAWAFQSMRPANPTPTDRAAMQRELTDLSQRMDKLAQRMGELSSKLALDSPHAMIYRYLADTHRGLIGLVLKADPKGGGFKVTALTPGGSAQQAGVKVGDVITRVNGKTVNVTAPSLWPLGGLEAGKSVKLKLLRDGKTLTVSLTARRNTAGWPRVLVGHALIKDLSATPAHAASTTTTTSMVRTDDINALLAQAAKATTRTGHYAILGTYFTPWWGLNMAPLNPDLARYFGTQHGALVLSTQPKRYPGLEAGDVITAVNGHAVKQPDDVMRALRGTTNGHIVHLTVLRHRHTHTITLKVPATSTDPFGLSSVGTRTFKFTVKQPSKD